MWRQAVVMAGKRCGRIFAVKSFPLQAYNGGHFAFYIFLWNLWCFIFFSALSLLSNCIKLHPELRIGSHEIVSAKQIFVFNFNHPAAKVIFFDRAKQKQRLDQPIRLINAFHISDVHYFYPFSFNQAISQSNRFASGHLNFSKC
jgi:hypothetical protein